MKKHLSSFSKHIIGLTKKSLTLDLRSLALFRIGLGIILLLDLGVRSLSLSAHYTNSGVLPIELLTQHESPLHWSLHTLDGSLWFQSSLFVFSAIIVLLLIVGFQTRVMTIISWVMLISLHNRNPVVLQGGDVELRMLVFWSMFLPLGTYFSIDRRIQRIKTSATQIISTGTLALLVQVLSIYYFSGLMKDINIWVREASAIYYALNIDQFTTLLGESVKELYWLNPWLSRYVYYLELYGGWLLLIPLESVRFLSIFLFVTFHLGLATNMHLGLFPLISILPFVAFLPSSIWIRFNFKKRKLITTNKWVQPFPIVFLAIVTWWNITNIQTNSFSVHPYVRKIVELTRIDQWWNMFSPYPLTDDGWYVMPATLVDSTQVNIFPYKQELNWDKPENVSSMYFTYRWRKYLMNLWLIKNAHHRDYYGIYACRRWNSNHNKEQAIKELTLYFVQEKTLIDKIEKPDPILLGIFECN